MKASEQIGQNSSSFKVTLVTPEGDKQIECPGDTYILDAA